MQPTTTKPLMFYVLGGFFFSLAGLLFKPLVGVFSPFEMNCWRCLSLLVIIALLRSIQGRSWKTLPLSFSRWQCFSAVALAGQVIFFAIAIVISSTADTFLLSNATPIYMVLWQGIFDRRLPSGIEWLIVGLASFGLFLFFAHELKAEHLWGLFSALLAGLSFSAHIYSQGRVGREGFKEGEPLTLGSVILGGLLTILVSFPLAVIHFHPSPLRTAPTSLFLLFCLSVFQFAVPIQIWARVLLKIPPLLAAFMPTLIAIWAPCWTYFLLSEPFPGALALLGAVIIHFAVLLAAIRRSKMIPVSVE